MKFLFLGDFYYDYSYIAKDIKEIEKYIAQTGCEVILNLEGAPGDGGQPIEKRGPNLRQSPIIIDVLKHLSVKSVCLANNHSMDYGYEALKDGLAKLDKTGILHAGAGKNNVIASEPIQINDDGKKVIIQNYGWDVEETVYATSDSPGCAPMDHEYIIKRTKELRGKNPDSCIINIFHWGFEFNTLPMPVDINLAHKCVDAGADLIIGHHPHVVQPVEEYCGKPIFYSLGNFYFSSRRDTFTRRFENEKYENMCDYGIGVIYDTEEEKCECIQIEYKRFKKVSTISENVTCLKNITGINWQSEDYIKKAKLHSSGTNPILGLDNEYNTREIKKLYFKYAVSKKLSFLKNNKFGSRVYGFLKKHLS